MNIENLKKFKKYNPDLKIRELKNGNTTVYIIYFETLCKSNTINDFILKPIYDDKIKSLDDIKNKLPSGNLLEINDENTLYDNLYSGFTIISIDNKFISFETKDLQGSLEDLLLDIRSMKGIIKVEILGQA